MIDKDILIHSINYDYNPEHEQLLEEMRDKLFSSLGCPLPKSQQIYISTVDMHDNPFAKMIREYLKNKTKENEL